MHQAFSQKATGSGNSIVKAVSCICQASNFTIELIDFKLPFFKLLFDLFNALLDFLLFAATFFGRWQDFKFYCESIITSASQAN